MRSLTGEEIEKLASRANVKRIAVENFLATMGNDYDTAMNNLELDAKSYRWNTPTKNAIIRGILLAAGKGKSASQTSKPRKKKIPEYQEEWKLVGSKKNTRYYMKYVKIVFNMDREVISIAAVADERERRGKLDGWHVTLFEKSLDTLGAFFLSRYSRYSSIKDEELIEAKPYWERVVDYDENPDYIGYFSNKKEAMEAAEKQRDENAKNRR